jgi:hypothetical protein
MRKLCSIHFGLFIGLVGVLAGCSSDDDDDGNIGTPVESCDGATDGLECDRTSGSGICLDEECVTSKCGDGFIDKDTAEQCDSGKDNGKSGGACAKDSTYVCESASDCETNECRKDSTCEGNVCVEGEAKPDDTACGETDEKACSKGTCINIACTKASDCDDEERCTTDSCVDEVCKFATIADEDKDGVKCVEDCDDADKDASGDQAWYPDCDKDGYAATGAAPKDTNVTTLCASPIAPPGICGAVEGGWTVTPPTGTGADCEDTDADLNPTSLWYADCDKDGYAAMAAASVPSCTVPETAPAACADGGWTMREPAVLDVDCDDTDAELAPTTEWYADCDGDQFASVTAETVASCTKPEVASDVCNDPATASWTRDVPADEETADCDDARATVNPSVVDWVSAKIVGQTNLNVDFDYDCNGVEEPELAAVSKAEATCTAEASPTEETCSAHAGWKLATVPACGTSTEFVVCALEGSACMATLDVAHVQLCR